MAWRCWLVRSIPIMLLAITGKVDRHITCRRRDFFCIYIECVFVFMLFIDAHLSPPPPSAFLCWWLLLLCDVWLLWFVAEICCCWFDNWEVSGTKWGVRLEVGGNIELYAAGHCWLQLLLLLLLPRLLLGGVMGVQWVEVMLLDCGMLLKNQEGGEKRELH